MKDIMVDCETLGTGKRCVLLDIAMVEFDKETGEIGEIFHIVCDRATQEAVGRLVDADTIAWWGQQSTAARAIITKAENYGHAWKYVLQYVNEFIKRKRGRTLWSNGANFDISILEEAFYCSDLKQPWQMWKTRCVRTLHDEVKDLTGVAHKKEVAGPTVAHNSVEDCKYQIRYVVAARNSLKAHIKTSKKRRKVMANKNGKAVDTTYLSIDQAEARGFIHRDYIAHCHRWSHVIKCLSQGQGYKTARILDIGCGRLMPMATMLHSSRMAPEYYCGVEYGPVDRSNKSVATTLRSDAFNCDIWDNTSITKMSLDEGEEAFNWVTCFEMLEHVEPKMVHDTLDVIRAMTTPDARIFISTPVFNGKAAANHVNEMTMDALGNVFLDHGFGIRAMHGTFASISDYRHMLNEHEAHVFERLRDYYDVNVLATIFAPLHPIGSRNILWELTPDISKMNGAISFTQWDEMKEPWSSSKLWEDLRRV